MGPDVVAQFDDPFAVPSAPPDKTLLTDGDQGDGTDSQGDGGDVGSDASLAGADSQGDGGDVGSDASLAVSEVPGVQPMPGGLAQGANPADAASDTLIDLAIADAYPDQAGPSSDGDTPLGLWLST
jgi:hypothetical protein